MNNSPTRVDDTVADTLGAFLTPEEIASRYKVSDATVYRWRSSGEGPPAIRVGGQYRYRTSDVLDWEAAAGAAAP